MKTRVAIIGAGPAGLTAGYLLSKEQVDVVVLEADPVYVGGISRTVTYNGFHFDIGGGRGLFKPSTGQEVLCQVFVYNMKNTPPSSHLFFIGEIFFYLLLTLSALV